MKYLFIIPARAGSKGVPGKNKRLLGNKPLITYSIECALAVAWAEDICVTTDDDDVITIATDLGLKVRFKRPDELAADNTGTFEVLKHALNFYAHSEKNYDAVVLLQPTSPFRTEAHVKEALKLYSHDLDMVVSVSPASGKLVFEEDESGFLQRCDKKQYYELRQHSAAQYVYNGAIYVINANSLLTKQPSEYSKVVKLVMDERSSFDIDTLFDWEMAECMIKSRRS